MTNRKLVRTVSQHEPSGEGVAELDAALDAVGDRTRRQILDVLRDGPLPVAAWPRPCRSPDPPCRST